MRHLNDRALRSAFAPARELDPTETEIVLVLRNAQGAREVPRRRVLAAVAACVVLLLGSSAYAVPTTRGAIEDVTSSFASWVAGDDEEAPGHALRAEEEAPAWVGEHKGRLIAKANGVGLYVTRTEFPGGEVRLDFVLGDGVIISDSVEGWRKRFADHAVVVLGPVPAAKGQLLDGKGRFPMLGVTARSVSRVVLRYTAGKPTSVADVKGGFVLMVDSRRIPQELIVYDVSGRELERTEVRDFGWGASPGLSR